MVPENNEVLKKKPKRMKYQRDTGTNLKELPMAKLEQLEQQNKHSVSLYFNI